ncbi:NACHT, LRR and PYD domains-containing protein 1-like [Octodon degus]|uniref:NACHT, LRR and PYD domains-containing protein 1-like n=1 Tax=Octodon degus TaxID=10160 RepID=A0A6P6F457_OCTDE|nr:NACHT, LRR and PYD domains-containing protein 1-like [Octodon degus]
MDNKLQIVNACELEQSLLQTSNLGPSSSRMSAIPKNISASNVTSDLRPPLEVTPVQFSATQLNLSDIECMVYPLKRKLKLDKQKLHPLKYNKTDALKGYEKEEEMPCFTHSWKVGNLHQFSQLILLQKDHPIQPQWHKTIIPDTQKPKPEKSEVEDQSGQLSKTLCQNIKNDKVDIKHTSVDLQSYPQHDQKHEKQEQTNKMHKMHDLRGQEVLFKESGFHNSVTKQGHLIEIQDLFSPDSGTQKEPRTVIVHGPAGIGKSALARQVRRAWQQGWLYRDHFQYVFYINCRKLARYKILSLAMLMAKDWDKSEVPIGKILSQPEQLLFILDGVDEPKWVLQDQNAELCWHWSYPLPVSELLGSLLRKTVLPGASFLITTRTTAIQKFIPFLAQPYWVEILGFSESGKKEYFFKYFTDEKQAIAAFRLVDSNSALWTLCLVPWVCWLACTCLKQQLEHGNKYPLTCQTTTALCLHYISQVFPAQKLSSELRDLCFLAAEGIRKRDTMFSAGDLKKHQLDEAIIFTFLKMGILQKHSSLTYSFTQQCFQEFFAAVYFILWNEDERQEHLNCNKYMEELLKRYESHDLFQAPILHFLFGLLSTEGAKEMEHIFSCKLPSQWKWQLFQWAQEKAPTQPPYSLDFFRCLYETQDEELLKPAMAHFQGTRMCIQTNTELLVFTFCVKFCNHVKQLQLNDGGHQPQASWSPEVARSNWLPLTTANWKAFFAVLQDSRSLKDLDLCGNPLSLCDLQYLCETLRDTRCYLETLWLASCSLTAEGCKDLAISISTNHRLINLDLSFNMITDSGARHLCQTLGSPQSKLQRLQLVNCGLTSRCCKNLASLLSSNPSLMELDLQQNDLSTHGVQQLFEGLRHPNCRLTLLCLDQTFQNEELSKELNALKEEKHHLQICSRWNRSVMDSPEDQDGRIIDNSTSSLQQRSQSGTHHIEPLGTENDFQGPMGPVATEVVDKERGLYRFYKSPGETQQELLRIQSMKVWSKAGAETSGGSVDTSLFHVAHFKEEGMLLEKPSRVETHYIVLENPSFSPMGIFLKMFSTARRFIPINCTTLLYHQLQPEDVKFHLYLIPSDCTIRKAIDDEEKKFQFTRIHKPPPMDSLYIGSCYTVSGSENLEIIPKELKLHYRSSGESQLFSEIYVDNFGSRIQLQIRNKNDGATVWEALLKPGDLKSAATPVSPATTASPSSLNVPSMPHFVDQHKKQLVERVTSVDSVLDKLYGSVLSEEQYESVRAEVTKQNQMRKLFSFSRSWDRECKCHFYKVLKETHHHLIMQLWEDWGRKSNTLDSYS